MLVVLLIVYLLAALMITLALYTIVRSHVFKTKPSDEFEEICKNFVDKHLLKHANKERVIIILSEDGGKSLEYINASLGVSWRSLLVYLDELEAEGRVVRVADAGSEPVYQLDC